MELTKSLVTFTGDDAILDRFYDRAAIFLRVTALFIFASCHIFDHLGKRIAKRIGVHQIEIQKVEHPKARRIGEIRFFADLIELCVSRRILSAQYLFRNITDLGRYFGEKRMEQARFTDARNTRKETSFPFYQIMYLAHSLAADCIRANYGISAFLEDSLQLGRVGEVGLIQHY